MQPSTAARNAISPLLEQLIRQLGDEGHSTQSAYFSRIRKELDRAQDELALVTPIRALTTYHAVGFQFSNDAESLIQRICEKVEQLDQAHSGDRPLLH